jgi:hypothetical protein
VQFYTKCAVLKTFVQFLKHECAVTKLRKIANSLLMYSLPMWMLQEIPEMLSLTEHQKYKRFLGEDPDPSYFPHNSLTCWGNGKEGKIAASDAPQKRLEWENLIYFAASNSNLRLLYIECP